MNADRQHAETSATERIRLAQEAFARYYAQCFWSWPKDTVITEDLLPNVAHALRSHGGRNAMILSEQICPWTTYKKLYSQRYARTETRTAT